MSKLVEIVDSEDYLNSPHVKYDGYSQMWIDAYSIALERNVIVSNSFVANIKLERLKDKLEWSKAHPKELKKIKELDSLFWGLKQELGLSIYDFSQISRGKKQHSQSKEIIKRRGELFNYVDSLKNETINRIELINESVRPSFFMRYTRAKADYPQLIKMIYIHRSETVLISDLEGLSKEDNTLLDRLSKTT